MAKRKMPKRVFPPRKWARIADTQAYVKEYFKLNPHFRDIIVTQLKTVQY